MDYTFVLVSLTQLKTAETEKLAEANLDWLGLVLQSC